MSQSKPHRTCSVDDCDRRHIAQGFCSHHYYIARRDGTIAVLDDSHLHVMTDINPEARIGVCRVCGPDTPVWSRGRGRPMCGNKGRADGAERRRQEHVIRYHKEYAKKNSLKAKLARYQLSLEQWEDLLAECDSRCSICGTELLTTGQQYVDHDHSCCGGGGSCGKCVRAILCRRCNFGIANFRDKPELVRRAAGYLERYAS